MALPGRACITTILALLLAALALSCGGDDDGGATAVPTSSTTNTLEVNSHAFQDGGDIPADYSCDGDVGSPDLVWSGVPSRTISLAVLVDDPDAGGFTHWLVYDVPPDADGVPAGVTDDPDLADGSRQGTNSRGEIGYTGPCPPSGTHTYRFQVFALDTQVDLEPGAAAKDVLEAMEGHVLAQGEMTGKFSR